MGLLVFVSDLPQGDGSPVGNKEMLASFPIETKHQPWSKVMQ
jgi:hypothetical protein